MLRDAPLITTRQAFLDYVARGALQVVHTMLQWCPDAEPIRIRPDAFLTSFFSPTEDHRILTAREWPLAPTGTLADMEPDYSVRETAIGVVEAYMERARAVNEVLIARKAGKGTKSIAI